MSDQMQSKYAWEGPADKALSLVLLLLVAQRTLSFLAMWASADLVGWVWTMVFIGVISALILWAVSNDPGYGSDHDWWE